MTWNREVSLETVAVILAKENKVWSRESEKRKGEWKKEKNHLGGTYHSPSSFTFNPP